MVCVGHESCWFFWIGSKLEQGLLLQPKRPNMLVEERRPRKMTLTFSFRNVYEDEISQIDLGPLTLHFLEANMNNPCEPECKPDQRLENG